MSHADEPSFKDRKPAAPVTCQRCDRAFWPKDIEQECFLPIFCPACTKETAGITFIQAMSELYDA